MPRSGAGTFSWPAGSYAVPNTPISSVDQNAILDDAQSEFNSARPVSAGGTGATSPASAFEVLSPMTARGDLVTRGATVSQRLPIGAAGTVLSSDGTDPLWKAAADNSSETVAGPIEIATEAENAARASAVLAVTPKYNPLPPGFLFGCTLSNGATPATHIDIAPGKARDSTDAVNITLAAAITKRLDAVWALGSGGGGLDTGTAANTTYHVWLIKRSDTGVVDALFSTSATAPTMPTNYTHKRRIGSCIRLANTILAFTQVGDEFLLNTPVRDEANTSPGALAVSSAYTIPLGIVVGAMISFTVETSGNAAEYALVTSISQANATPSASLYDVYVGDLSTGSATAVNTVWRTIRSNTAGQFRYRLAVGSASTTKVTVVTHGWIDTRGRLL
jgi:hypothetical protein